MTLMQRIITPSAVCINAHSGTALKGIGLVSSIGPGFVPILQRPADLCRTLQDCGSNQVLKRMIIAQWDTDCAHPGIVKMDGVLGTVLVILPTLGAKRISFLFHGSSSTC